MGIFLVLAFSGMSQLLAEETPGSLRSLVPAWITLIWATSMVIFGFIGFAATLARDHIQIFGLAIEIVCRLALGMASLVYAVGLLEAVGWRTASFAIMTYAGLAALLVVGALQIMRWLLKQRRMLRRVLGE